MSDTLTSWTVVASDNGAKGQEVSCGNTKQDLTTVDFKKGMVVEGGEPRAAFIVSLAGFSTVKSLSVAPLKAGSEEEEYGVDAMLPMVVQASANGRDWQPACLVETLEQLGQKDPKLPGSAVFTNPVDCRYLLISHLNNEVFALGFLQVISRLPLLSPPVLQGCP